MVEETGAPGGNHRASGVKDNRLITEASGTRTRRDSGLRLTLEWSCNTDSLAITATAELGDNVMRSRIVDRFSPNLVGTLHGLARVVSSIQGSVRLAANSINVNVQ
jgi:hypothetical protein